MVSAAGKNLWVAASDGDIERVQALLAAGATPNDKDAHSYTPMHAAASYAHLDLLALLLAAGGDVNLADDDGETPLYTCETVAAARWLVEHGADARHQNEEGMTAAQTLEEDHPEVAAYLRSVTGETAPVGDGTDDGAAAAGGDGAVSQMAVESAANEQTTDLMQEAQAIIEQAQRDGVDPDERLRELVQRAVRQGFNVGGELGGVEGAAEEGDAKRTRGV